MRKAILKRIIWVGILVTCVVVIFMFSSQDTNKSNGLSKNIATNIANIIYNGQEISKEQIDDINKVVRKLAHFTVYFIVGIFLYNFFDTYNITKSKKVLISQGIGTTYAVLDEIHQLFVNGRAARILDVGIDGAGVFIGVWVAIFVKTMKKVKSGNE